MPRSVLIPSLYWVPALALTQQTFVYLIQYMFPATSVDASSRALHLWFATVLFLAVYLTLYCTVHTRLFSYVDIFLSIPLIVVGQEAVAATLTQWFGVDERLKFWASFAISSLANALTFFYVLVIRHVQVMHGRDTEGVIEIC